MKKVKSLLIFTILATLLLAAVACSESSDEITDSPYAAQDQEPVITEDPDDDGQLVGGTPGSAGYTWDAERNGWHRTWDAESFIPASEKPEWDKFIPEAGTVSAIIVDESQSGGQIELTVGDTLMVKLVSNPSTGFSWQLISISDQLVLQNTDQEFILAESEVTPPPGTPGEEIWTFETIGAGVSTISMEYSRPWEGGEKAVETFTLTVTVTGTSVTPDAPDADIVEWTLVSLGDPDAPQSVLEGTSITITITEEDDDSISFRGSAGCNSYFGSFQMTEEGLKAGPIGATEMACMAEGVMNQEMQFLRALGTAEGWEVSGDTLQIAYDSGVLIFTVE